MKYGTILILLFLLVCCSEKKQEITDAADYDQYLAAKPDETTSKYFKLWNSKIKSDSLQLLSFGIVGGEYERYFQNTGDIRYLKKAEQVLKKAADIANVGRGGRYRALARNYISQHRFREALQLADSAHAIGDDMAQNEGLLFDVHMELGNYKQAKASLDSIKDMNAFGYLIRLAKWNDHKGDLDTTIRFMEKARDLAVKAGNKSLMLWSYTNLADYYGHAGRINDSYQHYLQSLQLDPANAYAKKGIAWIEYSYEKNPDEALRILDSISTYYKSPSIYLLKAEISDYIGEDVQSVSNLNKYFEIVKDPAYGAMYNVYNISLCLEKTGQYDKALALARQEVENRPTPTSYSLLATSYFKLGEVEKAERIILKHIQGKTSEPAVLLRNAEVYKAAGELDRVAVLKNELQEAIYELGPSSESSIANL